MISWTFLLTPRLPYWTGRPTDAELLRNSRIIKPDEMLTGRSPKHQAKYYRMMAQGDCVLLVEWPGPLHALIFYKDHAPTLKELVPEYHEMIDFLLTTNDELPPCPIATLH